jgi:hypothetical protein
MRRGHPEIVDSRPQPSIDVGHEALHVAGERQGVHDASLLIVFLLPL